MCSGYRHLLAQAIAASISNDTEATQTVSEAFRAAGLDRPVTITPAAVTHDALVPRDHARHAHRVEHAQPVPSRVDRPQT